MGEKKWNTEKGNWEIDGIPVTYRVTWRSVDSGGEQHTHTRDFSDVDQGYSFYQGMQKRAGAYDVTWDTFRGDRLVQRAVSSAAVAMDERRQ